MTGTLPSPGGRARSRRATPAASITSTPRSRIVLLASALSTSALLASVLLASALLASAAAAQTASPEDVQARVAFDEGLGLADRGDWAAAIARFEHALAMRDTPAIRFNLAQSLAHVGRLVEALTHLEHLEDGGEASASVSTAAQELRDQIAPRIGRVVVRVRGEAAGLTVEVPPHPPRSAEVEVTLAADPGPLTVRLHDGDEIVDQLEVSVPEGGVAHVLLSMAERDRSSTQAVAEASEHVQEPPSPVAHDDEDAPVERSDVVSEWWLWTLVAVVALGAVGGVVGGVVATQSGPEPSTGDFDPPVIRLELGGAF